MARRPSLVSLEPLSSSSTARPGRRSNSGIGTSYAKAIQNQCDLPIDSTFFSFQHYKSLSSFFNDPLPTSTPPESCDDFFPGDGQDGDPFVVFQTYTCNGHLQKKEARTQKELRDLLSKPGTQDVTGTLVFLLGHQPRDWLLAIGERYDVDYEFWRRHLDFDGGSGGRGDVPTDSFLPSNNAHIFQLSATTLGVRSGTQAKGKSSHDYLTALRNDVGRWMNDYKEKIGRKWLTAPHGESVLRSFALHDLNLFSFQQYVSLWVGKDSTGGWIAIAWLDFGQNLRQSGNVPWELLDDKSKTAPVYFHPTIQHRPGITTLPKLPDNISARKASLKIDENAIAQTACSLHKECGKSLDKTVACHDVFYALSDIFRFVASTEAQFLEMTQRLLIKKMDPLELSRPAAHKPSIMWDLLYNRQVLLRHAQQIKQIARFTESQRDLDWSRATDPGQRKVADAMTRLLANDFGYLLDRAEALSEEYQTSMSMLMNAATIDESQRAISQAEGVAKLTALAFFFVPLSFTTSIFGMNFTELSDGNHLSVWVWAATAAASLIFSLVCLKWFSWRHKNHDLISLKATLARSRQQMSYG